MANEVDLQFNLLAQEFGEGDKPAQVEKYGPVPGALSMFNPFNIFRYSKYGLNPNQYRANLHFDAGSGGLSQGDTAALMGVNVDPFVPNNQQISAIQSGGAGAAAVRDQALATNRTSSQIIGEIQPFTDQRRVVENPDAASIIKWAQLEATPGARTAKGATPYSVSDFIYCTYYGKVPNNRMVTLRRYPIPIEDNIAISAKKAPLVPLAQAVTWYGEDVGNKLGDILNLSWGFKWTPKTADVQDIKGNELTVEDLVAALGGTLDPAVVQVLKTQVFSGDDGKIDILKLSGYDVNAQEYIQNAYKADGPYWNRVLGPVNVIDSTYIRDRGFFDNKENQVKIKFKYSLRAYNGLNPKLVFLDLYSNFLSLTYNTAPFWGGGARYFQQTGVTIPQLQMEQKIFEGDMLGAIQVGAEQLAQMASSRLQQLIDLAKSATSSVNSGNILGADGEIKSEYEQQLKEAVNPGKRAIDAETEAIQRGEKENLTPVERALAPRLGKLMRKPLIYRSILDGRAVGEWHVTIGNPMNPMAMIGNLVLDKVTCAFNETLGLDDFPTEVTFDVTLKHGRPRAKQDIESIFNLGNGAMSFNQLPDPSSASNSYGENVTARLNSAREGISPEAALVGAASADLSQIQVTAEQTGGAVNQGKVNSDAEIARSLNSSTGEDATGGRSMQEIENLTSAYRRKVSRLYGDNYGNSPILTDYFMDLKTKD
jgi:hypothetical protein